MRQTARGPVAGGQGNDAGWRLASALDAAGFEHPLPRTVFLSDGSVGVELAPLPVAFAARLAEWIEERA